MKNTILAEKTCIVHQTKIYMKAKYYIEIRHSVQIIQKFLFKIMFNIHFCKILYVKEKNLHRVQTKFA